MITFNEWMAHIHRELGYPESKIKLYEQDRRSKTTISDNQRWSESDRRDADVRENKDNTRFNLN
jgi:hypothetical protein